MTTKHLPQYDCIEISLKRWVTIRKLSIGELIDVIDYYSEYRKAIALKVWAKKSGVKISGKYVRKILRMCKQKMLDIIFGRWIACNRADIEKIIESVKDISTDKTITQEKQTNKDYLDILIARLLTYGIAPSVTLSLYFEQVNAIMKEISNIEKGNRLVNKFDLIFSNNASEKSIRQLKQEWAEYNAAQNFDESQIPNADFSNFGAPKGGKHGNS